MLAKFTDRSGGVSQGAYTSFNLGDHVNDSPANVQANREILRSQYGDIQFMNQVHGNRIVIIESVTDEIPTADALVTGIPGVTLAVMVADCIPLLLSSNEAVAAVHVGRKGLVNGVAIRTLALMRDMGATAISAIIGPAICGKCYEVSEEIFNEVVDLHPLAASRRGDGSFALDLPRALTGLLVNEDVSVSHEGNCTVEDSQLFSYRRDGVTGRQVGVISL